MLHESRAKTIKKHLILGREKIDRNDPVIPSSLRCTSASMAFATVGSSLASTDLSITRFTTPHHPLKTRLPLSLAFFPPRWSASAALSRATARRTAAPGPSSPVPPYGRNKERHYGYVLVQRWATTICDTPITGRGYNQGCNYYPDHLHAPTMVTNQAMVMLVQRFHDLKARTQLQRRKQQDLFLVYRLRKKGIVFARNAVASTAWR